MNLSRAGIGVRASAALVLAACGGGSTEPTTGSMTVSVSGLPTGMEGSVSVTGPEGFNRSVGHSETLSALAPGSYTVAATAVIAGAAQYAPAPASQPVTVSAGETASAGVAYAVAEHSLAITVAGLPTGMDAAITVSGPGGYSHSVTASETLSDLAAGQYTLTALPVSDGSGQYNPSPSTRTVTVNGAASATVTYSTGSTAGFNLRVDGVYLVQSVQTYDRTVPVVRDRDALLRVFVTANQVNTAMPEVDVTLYADGVAIAELTIPAPGLTTPLAPDEATLNSSWNVILDRSLIRSNLSITATVDPGNAIAEGDEADNVFPASGTPLALDVRRVDPFQVMFVPVITKVNGRQGNVTSANRADYLETTTRMHPIESWDATVHAVYTTSTNLALQSDNGNNAWGIVLGEILALRNAESGTRYYYGVVNPNYNSGVAGVGYVGGAVAIGWDKSGSRGGIAAHEWGHNWGRQHAPCGGAGSPDGNYPYPNGEIGVIGYDVVNETLRPADAHDLMGYCSNEWISDYTYLGVMNWRAAESFSTSRQGVVQSGMLLWGRIEDGGAVLEPAVRVIARPSLPSRPGPYRLEGRGEDGGKLFGLDFAPLETAAEPTAAKHFAFVVPMRAEAAVRLASLQLTGPGIRASSAQALEAPAVTATRAGAGRIALRWDASKSPMLLVRDPVTGEVLSFARGGASEVATGRDEVVVTPAGRARHHETRVRVR
jgi:CARDB